MSKLDMINDEITRREAANADLIQGQQDILNAIEQFNKLDEMYKEDERASRTRLECLYKESRHFTGKQPIVYSQSLVETHPFFGGELDSECNPYFPITKVKDKTFDGLEPLEALPTRTGDHARDQDYSGTIEPTLRSTAMTALAAFPDTSGEVGIGSCTGETPPGSGIDQPTCLANGGTWSEEYGPGDTATEKLRAALDPWRAEIVVVMADLCEDTGNTEQTFWQDILDNIDDVLAAIQVDVTFPSNTSDFAPSSPEDIARDYLLANDSTLTTHVNNRSTYLTGEATTEEQVFFGVIKLRLHQANGSFAKLKASKGQIATNKSIIADNNAAIKSLNILKVKNS